MNDIKHIFFGDSLTQCLASPSEFRWVNLINKSINNKFRGQISYSAQNMGISGENTRQALERIQDDVQNHNPDILTIQFGANDSDYWLSNKGLPCVSEEAFSSNLIEMIDRARKFDIQNIILHTNHLFLLDRIEINNKSHSQNMIPYNDIIRKIAKSKDCNLIDIERSLKDIDPEEYCLSMPDGVHLSENGCRKYFTIIGPLVEKIINSYLKIEKK